MTNKFHRAFGCYGIIADASGLVVIKKTGGPYINRYDLPGGSLEDGEGLEDCLVREVKEETGLTVLKSNQIGITSFRYPWDYQQWHENQHLCVFYQVQKYQGNLLSKVKQFMGQDSLGAIKVPLKTLTIENASPLVLKAKEILLQPDKINLKDQTFSNWEVLDHPTFN